MRNSLSIRRGIMRGIISWNAAKSYGRQKELPPSRLILCVMRIIAFLFTNRFQNIISSNQHFQPPYFMIHLETSFSPFQKHSVILNIEGKTGNGFYSEVELHKRSDRGLTFLTSAYTNTLQNNILFHVSTETMYNVKNCGYFYPLPLPHPVLS